MLNNIGLPGLLLLSIIIVLVLVALSAARGKDKRRGSVVVLLAWAVIFFPIAILYAAMRRWGDQ